MQKDIHTKNVRKSRPGELFQCSKKQRKRVSRLLPKHGIPAAWPDRKEKRFRSQVERNDVGQYALKFYNFQKPLL